MSATLAEIWRHPVKGISAERLEAATLEAGHPMAWDRHWAIAHGGSAYDPAAPAWAPRRNFVVQAHVPELARTEARFDEVARALTLTHPHREAITAEPDSPSGAEALGAWIEALAGPHQPGPYRLAHVPGQALTDMEPPYVSILSLSSLRALGQHLGAEMHVRRFRGNLWLEGLAPWEEEEWVGRTLRIGAVEIRIDEPIGRCRATEASPATGTRDVDTVAGLRRVRGHTEFGVYGTVVAGGRLAAGDGVTVGSNGA